MSYPLVSPDSELERGIVRRYLEGQTAEVIGRDLCLGVGVIYRVLERTGTPKRRRGYTRYVSKSLTYDQRTYFKTMNDPARRKAYQEKKYLEWILRKYGLSAEEYKALRELQRDQCAICGESPKGTAPKDCLFVDHCHSTGKIRGLVCNDCNSGLGRFRDSIQLLTRAIEYLQSPPMDQLED